MLSFLYVYSDHSILECYNLFSGVELSMRSFLLLFAKLLLVLKPLSSLILTLPSVGSTNSSDILIEAARELPKYVEIYFPKFGSAH